MLSLHTTYVPGNSLGGGSSCLTVQNHELTSLVALKSATSRKDKRNLVFWRIVVQLIMPA